MIKVGILVFSLFLVSNAHGVMLPQKVHDELGLTNHLQKKPLIDHIKEMTPNLARVQFRLPKSRLYVQTPSHFVKLNETDQAKVILDLVFNSVFTDLSPEAFLSYRDIFFGYVEAPIKWGLQPNSNKDLLNPFFAVEGEAGGELKIHMAAELKHTPVFSQAMRLVALMEFELRRELIKRFGSPSSYHSIYPKIKAVSAIYSNYMIWTLTRLIPSDVLETEWIQLMKNSKRRIGFDQELNPALTPPTVGEEAFKSLLELLEENEDHQDWMSERISAVTSSDPDSTALMMEFSGKLIEYFHYLDQQGSWSDADELELAARVLPALTAAWKKIEKSRRFHIQRQAFEMKDSMLDSIIRSESIVYRENCERILNYQ